jgi:signal transduction histidine kinase
MEEKIRILVVDDEQPVLDFMERIFLYDGYEIITALSGEEGLNILSRVSPIQLVISDQRMPTMTGVEFLEQVCIKWPDTVRMILSGYADLEAVISAINRGQIYKFISKPWNTSDLRVTIGNAIERYFMHKKNIELAEKLQIKNDELQRFNDNLEILIADRTTELIKAQKQLINSEKMAAIGVLTAGIAHEIKNPLAVIIQGTGYLRSALQDDDHLTDVVVKLKDAAMKADTIIKGLLSFSRQRPLLFEAVDIVSLIEQSLSLMNYQLIVKNIHVIREYQRDLPMANLDSAKIEQVFVNVIHNAIEAMSNGGMLTIRVECIDSVTGNDAIQVIFTDTGKGIPENEINKIFDPFFSTKGVGNTGLGLSISRGIIDQHNGTIRVGSKINAGTSLFIILPIVHYL